MTELFLALNQEGGRIEWKGKVYYTGATTLEVMAEWEDWLASETLERQIRLLRKVHGGEDKAIRAVAQMSAEGVFDFYGETSESRMRKPSGLKQLFFIRIKQNHPDVVKATINEMIDHHLEKALMLEYKKEQASLEALLPNDEAPPGAESAGAPSLLAS